MGSTSHGDFPGTRSGRRKGVAEATPKISCKERASAQVGTQGTLAGVPSVSQLRSPVPVHRNPLLLRKPDFVRCTLTSSFWSSQSRFTEGVAVASSHTISGTPGLCCRSANRRKGQLQKKRGAKGSSKSEQGQESAVPVPAPDRFFIKFRGSPGTVRAVDCTSTSSVLFGSSHCLPLFLLATVCCKVLLDMCSMCTGVKDPLLQLARRILTNHPSPATGRPPRDLLPVPFYPVSEVLEPVNVNKDGTPMGWISATGVIQHVHRRLLPSVLPRFRGGSPSRPATTS